MTLDQIYSITNQSWFTPTPALLTQNLPSPYQGEGIEGWGITSVGQRFELKLTPMH